MSAPPHPHGPTEALAPRRRVSGKRTLALMLLAGMLLIGVVVAVAAGGMPSFHAPQVLGPSRKW